MKQVWYYSIKCKKNTAALRDGKRRNKKHWICNQSNQGSESTHPSLLLANNSTSVIVQELKASEAAISILSGYLSALSNASPMQVSICTAQLVLRNDWNVYCGLIRADGQTIFPFKLIWADTGKRLLSVRKINFLYVILLCLDTVGVMLL